MPLWQWKEIQEVLSKLNENDLALSGAESASQQGSSIKLL
jgi:hypothetical protein